MNNNQRNYLRHLWIITCSFGLGVAPGLAASLTLPSFFADGMVLQREDEAAIWGWAEPHETVAIQFADHHLETTADAAGAWRLVLEGLEASSQGRLLVVRTGTETREIRDVVVGEVWLASGQSNMEWRMQQSFSRDYAKTVSNPLIRHYQGERVSTAEPQRDFPGRWSAATPEQTPGFSAVAFHFAERLHAELGVPVGIIETAWGGMPIQSFISDEAIRQIPEGAEAVRRKAQAIEEYHSGKAEADYQKRLHQYEEAQQRWLEEGKKGRKPRVPKKLEDPESASARHSTIYQGMIHPFVGYGMRGVIWYQGERNAGKGKEYGGLLEGLIANWRSLWGKELSFYWVQLANFREASTEPGEEKGWVHLQDQQRRTLQAVSRSGMAVANDLGELGIHPGNKKDVGLRLARWALHQDYGRQDVVPSGPLFKAAQFDGGRVRLSFDYAEGLRSRDGKPLARFELAGPDGIWVWGEAELVGEQVLVTAPSVVEAVQVRYAWAMNPEGANLVNEADLPASCFSARRSAP